MNKIRTTTILTAWLAAGAAGCTGTEGDVGTEVQTTPPGTPALETTADTGEAPGTEPAQPTGDTGR